MKLFPLYFILCIIGISIPAFADEPAPLFGVSYAEAEAAVSQALAEKGAGEKVAATMNGLKNGSIFSYSKPLRVEIRGLTFDKPSGHWSANLLAMSDADVITALPAAGRFDEMVEIPVLKRPLRNGDAISQNDIEVRDFPVTHTRADTVTDIASLLGKSPLRAISPFRPIREHELESAVAIKKNGLVEMQYSSDGMMITTTGQAMEAGSQGAMIAVRNLTSKKIVRAQVMDANTVNVNPTESAAKPVINSAANQPQGDNPYATN